jgi:hypothetical protein
MTEEPEQLLSSWIDGAYALSTLRSAYSSGLLAALREPRSPEEAAAMAGVDPSWAAAVCAALKARGLLHVRDGAVQALPALMAMDSDRQPSTLGDRLGAARVIQKAIDAGPEQPGFEQADPDESLALARSVWGHPASRAALDAWRRFDRDAPEARELWEAGCEHAEFGCGVGRDLLRIPLMYPKVRAVGFELLEHIAAEARRNAAALGLDDRVTVQTADVRDLTGPPRFGTIVWSQMFFPPPSRQPTLEAITRTLDPGGLLLMPMMPAPAGPDSSHSGPPVPGDLAIALAYRRWQVQRPTPGELAEECTPFGLNAMRLVPHVRGTPFAIARRSR